MTELIVTTEEEYDGLILPEDKRGFVLLLTAPTWCGPCRQFEPHWKRIIKEVDDFVFVKFDLGSSPEETFAHWAISRFDVQSVPRVLRLDLEKDFDANPTGSTEMKSRTLVPFIKELYE